MSNEFLVELAPVADDAPAYLSTEYGKPFASLGSLDNKIRKWVIQAGLFFTETDAEGIEIKRARRSQHGIRKARAEEVAEQGGSVYEVIANLSHSDAKTSAIYTKRVERARLAEQAADRVDAAKNEQGVPRPGNRGTPKGASPYIVNISTNKW